MVLYKTRWVRPFLFVKDWDTLVTPKYQTVEQVRAAVSAAAKEERVKSGKSLVNGPLREQNIELGYTQEDLRHCQKIERSGLLGVLVNQYYRIHFRWSQIGEPANGGICGLGDKEIYDLFDGTHAPIKTGPEKSISGTVEKGR